jgi:hypothetical protein
MRRLICIDAPFVCIQSNNRELQIVGCAGAEMGIPAMISKEFAGMSRVKAAILTAQSDNSP